MSETKSQPKFMTIRQCAATGILPEHTLRTLVKSGRIPSLRVGNRSLIDYYRLIEVLSEV